jgi:ubiquinone biosynthesis protein
MNATLRSVRNIPRYQEIIRVFIKHGFGFIFENISSEVLRPVRNLLRSKAAAADQATTEDLAIHFRLALEELGPTFVKLGQVLSTRPDLLPAPFIKELIKLQDTVPPVPWDSIAQVITDELGEPPEQIFYHIETTPLAAASLAQVHGALLPNGEQVVVKVQRPHITKIIERDLDILADLAERFQPTIFGKTADLIGIADEFAFTLRNELNYRREAHNADRFRKNFSHEKYVYIPKVYWELTTDKVVVLERIHGIKIDDIESLEAHGFDRHQLALNAANLIIKEILEDGFFTPTLTPAISLLCQAM